MDDVAILPSKFNDLREKTGRLTEEAAIVGLKLNTRKCKTLRTEFSRNSESIVVSSEEVKDVEEFSYLGAIVEKKGGGSEDIRNNAEGTRCIPEAMEGVGRGIGKRAMICLFKTLV